MVQTEITFFLCSQIFFFSSSCIAVFDVFRALDVLLFPISLVTWFGRKRWTSITLFNLLRLFSLDLLSFYVVIGNNFFVQQSDTFFLFILHLRILIEAFFLFNYLVLTQYSVILVVNIWFWSIDRDNSSINYHHLPLPLMLNRMKRAFIAEICIFHSNSSKTALQSW